jgi:TPR repeat protein
MSKNNTYPDYDNQTLSEDRIDEILGESPPKAVGDWSTEPMIKEGSSMSSEEEYAMYVNLKHGVNGYEKYPDEAFNFLLRAARGGDWVYGNATAQWIISKMLYNGDFPGVDGVNLERSIFWLEAAARDGHISGDSTAQWILGNKCKSGDGVLCDLERHHRLTMASTKDGDYSGHTTAQRIVGNQYKHGEIDGKVDLDKYMMMFKGSARGGTERGDSIAKEKIHRYIVANDQKYLRYLGEEYIKIFKINYKPAEQLPDISWKEKPEEELLSDKTSAKKQYAIYKNYYYGSKGCEKDHLKAMLFLKAAARQGGEDGSPYAQSTLAFKYLNGDCVEENKRTAVFYFHKASRDAQPHGAPAAQFMMSKIYSQKAKSDAENPYIEDIQDYKDSPYYAEHLRFLKAAARDGEPNGNFRAKRKIAIKHLNGEDGFEQSNEEYMNLLVASTNGGKDNGDEDSQEDIYNYMFDHHDVFFNILLNFPKQEIDRIVEGHQRNEAIKEKEAVATVLQANMGNTAKLEGVGL